MGYSKQEQAFRAKDSALEKMAKQDFTGAKKLALMARKLDPTLEDIVHVILVCDVHARGGGDEDDEDRDWYKILDVDPKADEDSIRNQYNRLALNLHPDKIRLPGSGEAFRLVCQAKAVLTDDGRRRSYDGRRKSKKLLEDSWRSDLGFSGFKNDDKSQDSGFVEFGPGPGPEGALNVAKDLGFAKFRNVGGGDAKLPNSGFVGFRNGPGPFGLGVLNNGDGSAGSAKLQESSGFATFQNRAGPFDRGYLSNSKGGAGNEKAGDSGFTAFRNGLGPLDRDLLSNSKGAAGNAKVKDSGSAKNVTNRLGPFDICYGNNLQDVTPNAEVNDSGFMTFQTGPGPLDCGLMSNLKDAAGNGNVQDSSFAKNVPNGPGPLDICYGNEKTDDPGFMTFQNGPGPIEHGLSSNSKGAAGNAEVQDSGFAENIRKGPGPFDICYGNNLQDGTPNAKVQDPGFTKHGNGSSAFDNGSANDLRNAKLQDSGFTAFQNGPSPIDRGLSSNLKGAAGNANVQDSGFARNVLNESGPFDISYVNNSKDGTLNATVQDSGFTKHGNGSSEFDHGSVNDLRNAKLHDSGFTTLQNGPSPMDCGLASNAKGAVGNANVQDSGFAKNIPNGPGPFDICSGNNSRDGTPNAKVHDSGYTKHGNGSSVFDLGSANDLREECENAKLKDSGFAAFQNGSGPSDHVSVNNTKDGGDRNGKLHDSTFAKIQNGPDPSHQEAVSNNTRDGNGNAELQNPSVLKIQNGPGPSDKNQETLKNADISKPKEKVKKKVVNVSKPKEKVKKKVVNVSKPKENVKKKGVNVSKPKENVKKKIVNRGVEPQFSISPGVNPQFPGNSVTPTSARAIPNLKYLDSELNDFEKGREKERFRPGQIWAVYDTLDAMPRFYALIKKVISSDDFKVHITWLEPSPENEMEKKWLHKGLPASCGRFKLGESEEINDPSIFSHLVNSENGIRSRMNTYMVYPRKGETWAVFKNWKMDWDANEGFEFDFVEIVSGYSDDLGVRVGFLGKVKEFSTIFSRVNVEEEVEIMGKDKLRFSHRVSSFRMKSPNGSSMFFELDPASLPEEEKSNISQIFS